MPPARAALVALAFTLLQPAAARGQGCCTPGTSPLGGLTGPALEPWTLECGLVSGWYELRQAYRGSEREADPALRHSRVDRVLGWVRLGLPGAAVLIVELPYEYRMREQPQPLGNPGEMFRLANTDLGDLSTSLMVRVLPRSRLKPWGVNAGLGMKWGTASVEREQDGLRLPVELQTGTGSHDPLVLGTAHRLWSAGSVTLAALTRFPREGRNGYRYGNETHAVVVGDWSPRFSWSIGGELRVRAAAADRYLGIGRPNTGGWRLMAGPRASASWRSAGLGLEGALLWPAQQDLNGLQIGVDREAILGVRWAPS